MRKLVKVLLATTLVMSMGITAMAAPSVSTTYSVSAATDADGNSVSLTVSSTPTETITAADAITALALDVDSSDVAIIAQEITAPEGSVGPYTITLDIAGVTEAHPVYVLHYTGSEWEVVEATAGDGTVTFTVDSLSPIAVVIEEAVESPVTGDMGTATIMMFAVVALGTAFVVSKRKVA